MKKIIENKQTIRIAIDVVRRITPALPITAQEISAIESLLWEMDEKLNKEAVRQNINK